MPWKKEHAICSIGVIADIQYADCDDGKSFRNNPRYYRNALKATKVAIATFIEEKVAVIVNLGDTVDAKSSQDIPSSVCLDRVLEAFVPAQQESKILHVYGNHELAIASREEMQEKMNIPFVVETPDDELVGYYSFAVPSSSETLKIRIVVLDTYDICVHRNETSAKYVQAAEILRQNNPNKNPKSPDGLVGPARRFVTMGGGVGAAQLKWLKQQLQTARESEEMVIILSHQPINPDSVLEADLPASLTWNYEQLVDVLQNYADTVAACFCGHAHRSGYARDCNGIHYRLVEAALECHDATFAVLDITHEELVVRGFGDCQSAIYTLDHLSMNNRRTAGR